MKSLKASMEGEWFGLTCGCVCSRLLSAKTLTSWGSRRWILGNWPSDSLRILRQMKSVTFAQSSANVWGGGNENIERESGRKREGKKPCLLPCPPPQKKEKKSSHLPLLPSVEASTHSVIRTAPSDRSPLRAFITQLKLCYCCGWHSKRTTRARQFISRPFHLEEFLHVCVCERRRRGL